jgi:hypothetical protein
MRPSAALCIVVTVIVFGAAATAAAAAGTAAWSIQPTPNPAGARDSVLSGVSCPSRRACTAVGHATTSTGVGVPIVERWQNTGWSMERVPRPAAAKTTLLFDVSCPSRSACVAVGSVTNGARRTVPIVERWHGTRWEIQRTPKLGPGAGRVSYLGGVSCRSSSSCVAVGYSGNRAGTAGIMLSERWNGVAWTVQHTPHPAGMRVGFLASVSCASPTSCIAVGFFIDRAGAGRALAERWNGARWSIQQAPNPAAATALELVGISCTNQGPCIAAGFFTIVTGTEVMLAERWNGARWKLQRSRYPAGARGVQFSGVSCTVPDSCTAVGLFNDAAGLDQALVERWDGKAWGIQPVPSPRGATSDSLAGISCTSRNACTAVGSFIGRGGTEETLAERYP